MPEINWDLARAPELSANALQYHSAGQAAGQARAKQNALLQYSQNPTAGINALMAIDPALAGQLQDRQVATQAREARVKAAGQYTSGDQTGAQQTAAAAGDFDLLKSFREMSKEQLEENKRINDTGIAVSLGLKKVPLEQRQTQLQSMTPQLKAQGFTDAQIAAIPLDDAGIDAGVGLGMKASEIIAQTQKDREFAAGRDDETWKRGFEGQKFDHTVQNDAAQLGQGQQRINIARQSEARQAASASRAAMGKPIPAPIVTGYQGNNTAVSKIRAAIAAIEARPQALGLDRALGEGVNQRIDPGGIDARAMVSDIGSQKIHDRSGANVTASENPRLKPFIPTVTDTPQAAIKKLRRMEQEYLSNNAQIEAQYAPESGYQALRSPSPAAAPPAPAPPPARASPPQRGQVIDGYRYNGGPPGSPQSWSKQ